MRRSYTVAAGAAAVVAAGGLAAALFAPGAASAGGGSPASALAASASTAPSAHPAWPGGGFGGGDHDRHGLLGRGLLRADLAVAAGTLHLSTAALMADLASGKSLAAVAAAQHVPVSTLEAALVAAADAQLAKAVGAGHLTAAQEATLKAQLPALIAGLVTHAGLHRPGGGGPGWGGPGEGPGGVPGGPGGMGGGWGGPGPSARPSASASTAGSTTA